MNELVDPKKELVTIKELSNLFKVSRGAIENATNKHFPEKMKKGITTYLNEVEVTIIKKEIEGHHNLSSTCEVENIKTQIDKQIIINQALQYSNELIEELNNQVKQLEYKVEIDKPKVEGYNIFIESGKLLSFEIVAKNLSSGSIKMGRNTLIKRLREKKVLQWNNIPYQKYLKYFEVKEKIIKNGSSRFSTSTTKVKPEGVEFIYNLLFKTKEIINNPRVPRILRIS